jgi:hypothetical protein
MFAEIVLKLDLSEISLLDPAGDLEHGSLQKDAVWSNIVTCRWCHFSLDSLTLVNLFTTSRHAFGVLMKRERVALRSMINDLAHFAYTTHGIEPTDTIGAISDLGRRFLIENNHRDFLLHKVPEVVTYKNALTSLLSASEWDNPDLEDALCESELLLVLGRLNLEWFSEIVRDRHPSNDSSSRWAFSTSVHGQVPEAKTVMRYQFQSRHVPTVPRKSMYCTGQSTLLVLVVLLIYVVSN